MVLGKVSIVYRYTTICSTLNKVVYPFALRIRETISNVISLFNGFVYLVDKCT